MIINCHIISWLLIIIIIIWLLIIISVIRVISS